MRSITDDEETVLSDSQKKDSGQTAQPAWMRAIYANVDGWLKMLPKSVAKLKRTTESMKNPLFRVFERENQIGQRLLASVRQDLEDLKLVCTGAIKQTNHLRMLLNCLTKGIVPDHWRRYKVSKNLSLSQW